MTFFPSTLLPLMKRFLLKWFFPSDLFFWFERWEWTWRPNVWDPMVIVKSVRYCLLCLTRCLEQPFPSYRPTGTFFRPTSYPPISSNRIYSNTATEKRHLRENKDYCCVLKIASRNYLVMGSRKFLFPREKTDKKRTREDMLLATPSWLINNKY